MKKILYIAPAESVHFIRWYRYFIERGYEVYLLSEYEQNSKINDYLPDLRVYYLSSYKRKRGSFTKFVSNTMRLHKICREVKKIIDDIKPNLVHAHQIHPHGFWAALAGFHPFISTPIGSDAIIFSRKYWVYKKISEYVLSKADLITADSLLVKDACIERGMDENKFHLVQNGLDQTRFNTDIDKKVLQKKYSISPTAPVIFFGRSFTPLYNVDKILQTIPLVLKQFPDSKFIFASHFGNLEAKLRKLATSLNVSNAVIFTGFIPHDEMPEYIASASINLSVPSSDNSPSSVYEAMACGVPSILSDLPWTKYAMRHLSNCFIIDSIAPKHIADAIITLLGNAELREKIISNGIKTVKEYFDYSTNMMKMERLMLDLYERKYPLSRDIDYTKIS